MSQSNNNNNQILKNKYINDILDEENVCIDSDLSDYEDVIKPFPRGAHLSEDEEMEQSSEIEKGETDQIKERTEDLSNLREHLEYFYDTKVYKSLQAKTSCEDIAYNVTHKVIRKVQTADARFRANSLVSLGIPYDGLHAGEPIYFEMMLQISIGVNNNSICLLKDKNADSTRVQPATRGLWEDCMDKHSQCISAKRVLRLLRQYVKRAVHVIRKYIDANNREKLPEKLKSLVMEEGKCNLTLIINEDIRVKVLPSISIPDCRTDLSRKDCPSSSHVVAVPQTTVLYDGILNNDDIKNATNKFSWKFSFFVAEKNKMRTVSDGCRIKLLRILTEIRDSEPKLRSISAYQLKTIFFHEIDQHPRSREWNETKLSQRFLGLLRRIHDYIQEGICPSYFMKQPDFPSINLFEDIERDDLNNMQRVLDEIISNPLDTLGSVMSSNKPGFILEEDDCEIKT